MTTAWAHLPNAPYIDWVLKSLKEHPEVWHTAWDAARDAAWHAARDAAWHAARDAARDAAWHAARGAAWHAAKDAAWSVARDAARDAAWHAARDAAWHAARDAARDAAWHAARDAIAALIADDDCSHLYKSGLEHIKCVHALDSHFSSLLLQPAAYVWSKTHGHE